MKHSNSAAQCGTAQYRGRAEKCPPLPACCRALIYSMIAICLRGAGAAAGGSTARCDATQVRQAALRTDLAWAEIFTWCHTDSQFEERNGNYQ